MLDHKNSGLTSSTQLETWGNDLSMAIKCLSDHLHGQGTASAPHLAILNGVSDEADRARRIILTIATRLQTVLAEPAEIIQDLASKVCRTRPPSSSR